ncbi:MAG: hypothetical protein WD009_12850 [Phycisphaeraceae bacterium]
MRRFLLILLILVALLLVAGGITTHIILRSDLPRRIAERALVDALGLDVRIASLRVGWTGRTDARGVRVALPLDDDPLLEAPRVELDHTAILALAMGRRLELRDARIIEPTIYVRKAVDGQWNLQQAHRIVATRLAQRPPRPGPPRPLDLPRLEITDGHLILERHDAPPERFDHLTVRGRERGPMAYGLEIDAPALGGAEARFAGVAPFTHEADFDLRPSSRLLNALLGGSPDARMVGQWRGRYEDERLRGTLALTELSAPGLRLAGSVRVSAGPEPPQLEIEPIRLNLHVTALDAADDEPIRLTAGRILVHDQRLRFEGLRGAALGGWAELAGELQLDTRTGQLTATWDRLEAPPGFAHAGRLDVTLQRHGPRLHRVQATAQTQGSALGDPYRATLDLTATGSSLTNLTGSLRARELRFAAQGAPYRLDDAAVRFRVAGPEIALTQIDAHDPAQDMRLTGQAQYDRHARAWSVALDARQLALPGLPTAIDVLTVRVRGDEQRAVLDDAELHILDAQATATGEYVFDADQPLTMAVRLNELALPAAVAAVDVDGEPVVLHARRIAGEATMAGTLWPLDLAARADLVARDLHVHRDVLGDVELRLHAHADRETAGFHADAIEWLDGQWRIGGRLRRDTGQAELTLEAEDIDLTLLEGVLDQPLGLTLGRADLAVRATPGDDPAVRGRFSLRNVDRHPVAFETLTGELRLANGRLTFHDIDAAQDDGRLTGEISLPLAHPARPRVELDFDNWPVTLGEPGTLAAAVSGQAAVEIDIPTRRGRGDVTLAADVARDGEHLARADLAIRIDQHIVHLARFTGDTLDGRLAATGHVDLHTPLASELHLEWTNLRPRQLAEISPHFRRVRGQVSGALSLGRSTADRPLGVVQLDVTLQGANASYSGLAIGDGSARVFFDFERPPTEAEGDAEPAPDAPGPSLSRVVLEHATLQAVEGQLSLWGRAVRRPGRQLGTYAWFGHLDGTADEIDLETLTRALNPDGEPAIGRLSAQMNLAVPLAFDRPPVPDDAPELAQLLGALPVDYTRWPDAFGRGSLALAESDIANVPLFAGFYGLMNLRLGGRQPDGRGEGRFRVEDGLLLFESFRYHNRGLQINLAGRLHDLWEGGDSELTGYALLSLQPLPDVEFIDVLGDALTALQAGMTSVEFYGTVSKPEYRTIPLQGLRRAIRGIVTGSSTPQE